MRISSQSSSDAGSGAGGSVRPATVIFDGTPLTVEDVAALARRDALACLSESPAFRGRIERGMAFLDRLLAEEGRIYGVTTGYGDSCGVEVPVAMADQLPPSSSSSRSTAQTLS